jgi:hypothetical protein
MLLEVHSRMLGAQGWPRRFTRACKALEYLVSHVTAVVVDAGDLAIRLRKEVSNLVRGLVPTRV